jgi:hypothetical protein
MCFFCFVLLFPQWQRYTTKSADIHRVGLLKAEQRMLRDNLTCDSQKYWICRLLLLCLVFFALSPIADAYTDSLCPSLVFFNDLYDEDSPVSINDLKLNDALNSLHVLKRAFKQKPDIHALLLDALAIDGPACHLIKREIQLLTLTSSQSCPPLFSDPSPPVA